MSLLIIRQEPTTVALVTDTLVSDEHRTPVAFAHKVFPLPRLNLVVAMTGTADLVYAWSALIDHSNARDIEDVNDRAQVDLRRLYDELTNAVGPHGSSTFYVFGYPSGSENLVRYTYRSVRDFEPERREVTEEEPVEFGAKPRPHGFDLEAAQSVDGFIDLACRIRDENDRGVSPEPVAIGGDLILTLVQNGQIDSYHLYRFPDHEAMAQAIGERA